MRPRGRGASVGGENIPFTFKGCGTKYYGEADRRPDGSYICTEWFVLAYLPIFPLGTQRVRRDKANDVNILVGRSDGYVLIEQMKLSWPQVGWTYAFVGSSMAWWVVIIWLVYYAATWTEAHPVVTVLSFVVLAALPFLWLRWMQDERYKAKYGSKP